MNKELTKKIKLGSTTILTIQTIWTTIQVDIYRGYPRKFRNSPIKLGLFIDLILKVGLQVNFNIFRIKVHGPQLLLLFWMSLFRGCI